MTKRTKPRTPKRGKRAPPIPMNAELRQAQAARILEAFAAWLAAAPGRAVTLEHGPKGWRSTLTETRPSGVRSASLTDAAAQSASVCFAEVAQ